MADESNGNGTQRMFGRIEEFMRNAEKREGAADDSRRRVYETLQRIEGKVDKQDTRLTRLESTVEVIEPLAEDWRQVRERSKGVFAAMIVAWTFLGGFLMWMGNNLITWMAQRGGL